MYSYITGMIRPGRPTLYRPEQCVLARQHCQQGASNDALARELGVAPRSIDNWIARIPAFAAAVREGTTRRAGKKGRKGRNPKNLDKWTFHESDGYGQ